MGSELSLEQIWESTLTLLSQEMTRATFNNWLRGTSLVQIKGNTHTVETNSPQALEWLENRLKSQVERALGQVVQQTVQVRFCKGQVKRINERSAVQEKTRRPAQVMQFEGFPPPEQNWSRFPLALIDAFPIVETVGELKVIVYLLRHTWGFNDVERRISLDEFMSGRRRRDGGRIDNGTGLTKNTVKDGIRRAIKHGFILVSEDRSDPARISRYYRLRLKTETASSLEMQPRPVSVEQTKFPGFPDPEENWSKLPHVLIDALPLIETVAELKVILYILRCTWAWRQEERLITLDEFMSGKKNSSGGRADNGTGLSKNAVRDGIERAIWTKS